MIIRLTSTESEALQDAEASLGALLSTWGEPIERTANNLGSAAPPPRGGEKVVDPISLAALVLSIPSAALAVIDLVDRLSKRRRADALIKHARELKRRRVTVTVVAADRQIDLASLSPDELLDLTVLEQQ